MKTLYQCMNAKVISIDTGEKDEYKIVCSKGHNVLVSYDKVKQGFPLESEICNNCPDIDYEPPVRERGW